MSLTQEARSMFVELYNRVEGLRAGNPGVGKVFWVDGINGSDTLWNGLRPTVVDKCGPLATVTEALTRCTALEDDYILVLNGGAHTHPIAVEVDRVHIIGITNPGAPQTVAGWVSGAFSCITVDASHVEIAGFQILSNAGNPGIEILGQAWGLWVHHCMFGGTVTTQDGIYSGAVEGPVGGLIENNVFDLNIGRDGCRLYAPTRTVIRNNNFRCLAGIGVHIYGPGQFGAILDNDFATPDANGAAITIVSAITVDGLAAGNNAGCEKAADYPAGTNDPYHDGGTNHWTDNYQNNVIAVIL